VFAGAARAAVFSNPEVIRRVNASFVPVALKAGLVNNPPNNAEGRLYREIARSKAEAQGICVINSAGKVLDWALTFDDDPSVLDFLDHAVRRFAEYPSARKPVTAERYSKYPSVPMEPVNDNGMALIVPARHVAGTHCPGTPPEPKGTVLARLFGRALDPDGRPVADTLRQEHYVEDRFAVPVAMQQSLAAAMAAAGVDRFRLPAGFARLLADHAYLGQLDVNPVSAPRPGSKGNLKIAEFWAQKIEGTDGGSIRIRVDGRSEALGNQGDGDGPDQRVGLVWRHEVKLVWAGLIELKNERISRLLLTARGSEQLMWTNKQLDVQGQADITRLLAGHPIDLKCGVRYGIIGEPVLEEEPGKAATAAGYGAPRSRPE
jgi:hypothetical protein